MNAAPTILMVAGESSGEQHAAEFCRALRARSPHARVLAVGGDAMRAAGAEILADVSDLAVVGFSEVVKRLPRLLALSRRLKTRLTSGNVDLFVPVDFPDFNFRLGRAAHRAAVPVFYYIAPQAWAWREGRARDMATWCDHLGVIFPFEESFFRERGVTTTFLGHPSLGHVSGTRPPSALRAELGVSEGEHLIALLPGSRESELARHLPTQIGAARALARDLPGIRIAIGRAPALSAARVSALADGHPVVVPPAFDLIRAADLVITASGTATVEVALAGTPMIVMYRVSALTWRIAKRLVRTPHVAMANLIAGERLVPEFLQDDATPEAIANAAAALLHDENARAVMRDGYARVRTALAGGAGLDHAAEIAFSLMEPARRG